MTIYTIGHGRQSWADFLALLEKFEIEMLCDVRTAARSRWAQFNGAILSANLRENKIGYEHLPECGGKVLAQKVDLESGVERILEIGGDVRTVLMCSESQPLTNHKTPRANCHRVGLLAPILKRGGAEIIHILPDGDSTQLDESAIISIW